MMGQVLYRGEGPIWWFRILEGCRICVGDWVLEGCRTCVGHGPTGVYNLCSGSVSYKGIRLGDQSGS